MISFPKRFFILDTVGIGHNGQGHHTVLLHLRYLLSLRTWLQTHGFIPAEKFVKSKFN